MAVCGAKRSISKEPFDCFEESLVVMDHLGEQISRGRRAGAKVKLALFDLDETLITTISKKVFSQNASDWKFKYDSVLPKLKELSDKGFQIFVVTNQLGISKGFISVDAFTKKLNNVLQNFPFRVQVLAASKDDKFRKPRSGAFEYILQHLISTKEEAVDKSLSFYCGDSAGRTGSSGGHDHSSADLLFALNIGLNFKTPEEFFLEHQPYVSPLLDKKMKKISPESFIKLYLEQYSKHKKTLIFISGPPRSGKTFLASFFKGFEVFRITNANYRSKLERLRLSLAKGAYKVVIDFSVQSQCVTSEMEEIIQLSSGYKINFSVNYSFEFVKEMNYHSYFEQRRGHDSFTQLEKTFHSYVKPFDDELFDVSLGITEFVPQFGRHPIEL